MDRQIQAAKIIQESFRKYLNRKYKFDKLDTLSTTQSELENFRLKDAGEARVKYSKEVWEVRNSLESFYKKIAKNSDRNRHVDDLIRQTDQISDNLKYCKPLEALESENMHIAQHSHVSDEAKKKHEEKLRQFQLQWWETLNLCDE